MKRCFLAGLLSLATLVLLPLRVAGQTGELRVVVVTSGSDLDRNGYVIALDTLRQSVGVNSSALFGWVKPGINTVTLVDLAEHCIVPEGNPRKVTVLADHVAELRFQVVCGGERSVAALEREVMPGPQLVPEPQEVPELDVAPPPVVVREAEMALELEVVPAPEVVVESVVVPGPDIVPEPVAAPDVVVRSPVPTMNDFSVGQWVATVEPPNFPAYPVRITFYPNQVVGGIVGIARYEAQEWSCSYDLLLEIVGDDDLAVTQRLTSGHCPEGNVVVFKREGDSLRGEWLRPDKRPWFEATFARSR